MIETSMPPTMAPVPVLFVHYGDEWLRGSEMLLLSLLAHLDPARVRPFVWCNGVEMAEACRNAGVPVRRTDFSYFLDAGSPRLNPLAYAALVREAVALCRENGIRVLHANSAAPTQWLVPAARTLRLPLLSHLHIAYLRRSRYALLLHQADLVVGVSAQALEGLASDGLAPGRLKVIYNGIDFARLDAAPTVDLRAELGIASSQAVIGTAGSLIPRKGHDVLLRAISLLGGTSEPGPDPPHLVLAGDGPERGNIERLARQLGLADRVHLVGHIPDVAALYSAADVFALASRSDSFGLVLAEAGYMGKPVVSTRVGGVPEVVLDDQTGFLVDADDPTALAAALRRLLTNRDLGMRLGQAGRARARSTFAVERMAREFEGAYERLASLPPGQLGWASVAGRTRPYAKMFSRFRKLSKSPVPRQQNGSDT